jgi:hypothetical protein
MSCLCFDLLIFLNIYRAGSEYALLISIIGLTLLRVCGSDLHAYHAPLPGICPTSTEPNILTGEKLPITLGHE